MFDSKIARSFDVDDPADEPEVEVAELIWAVPLVDQNWDHVSLLELLHLLLARPLLGLLYLLLSRSLFTSELGGARRNRQQGEDDALQGWVRAGKELKRANKPNRKLRIISK